MRLNQPHLLALVLATLASPVLGQDGLNDTRVALESWMKTRQLISRTQADWRADKEVLEQTVALYERELSGIEEQMSRLSTNNVQVAREMAEAEALKQSSGEATEAARRFATGFEEKLKKLVPRLPQPLQDILKKDLMRMPADPADTKMLAAERVQVCVGILNELDKFNNGVNLFSEKRRNSAGDEVAVETVYVGLGAAYFVNDAGDLAGVGAPGPNGWEWTVKPEIAPAVRQAVKIYRSEHPPAFVKLPATIR